MQGLRLAIGVIGLIAATAAVIDTSRRAARRWWQEDKVAYCLATVVFATSLTLLILEVCGVIGLLEPAVVVTISLLIWVAASRALPPRFSRLAPPRERQAPLGAQPFQQLIRLLLLALVILLFASFVDSVYEPRPWFDVLAGHLPVAVEWLQAGNVRLWPYVSPVSAEALYPANSQLMALWLLVPTHRDFLVQLGSLPGVALLIGGIAMLAQELGADRRAATAAALIVPTLPLAIGQLVGTNMTDMMAAGGLVAAGAFVASLRRRPRYAEILAAGLASGIAVGSRYAAIVALIPLLMVMAAELFAQRRALSPLRAGAVFALGLASTGSYFYLRNLVITGDPVYPQSLPFHNVTATVLTAFPSFKSYLQVGFQPGGWLVAVEQAIAFGGPLFVVLVGASLVPVAVGVVRRDMSLIAWLWAILPLVEFLAFVSLPLSAGYVVNGHLDRVGVTLNLRYLLPTVSFSAAIMAAELSRWRPKVEHAVLLVALLLAPIFAVLDSEHHLPLVTIVAGGLLLFAFVAVLRVRPNVRALGIGAVVVAVGIAVISPQVATHYDQRRLGAGVPFEDARLHLADADSSVAVAGFCEIYGLYGPKLERRVEYITGADGQVDRPLDAGYQAWLSSLRTHQVSAVVVGSDVCFLGLNVPQVEWTKDHPEIFDRVYASGTTAIYRVRPG